MPRDREGRFSTELFDRYQHVSTRKVKAITEELCGQAVAPTRRLAASSVLAPATNSDQWPPVAKHTAAKRSRSALALAAFEVL